MWTSLPIGYLLPAYVVCGKVIFSVIYNCLSLAYLQQRVPTWPPCGPPHGDLPTTWTSSNLFFVGLLYHLETPTKCWAPLPHHMDLFNLVHLRPSPYLFKYVHFHKWAVSLQLKASLFRFEMTFKVTSEVTWWDSIIIQHYSYFTKFRILIVWP